MTAPTALTSRLITEAVSPEPLRTDDWRARAACRGVDPEQFFPDGRSHDRAKEADAKAICAGCPVRTDCLSWALDTGQPAGVWGGLSRSERLTLGRQAAERAGQPGEMRGVLLEMAQSTTVRQPTKPYPAVYRLLEREKDLRQLRQQGVNLRRCAAVLGAPYETVRLAWKVLTDRDAAGGGES